MSLGDTLGDFISSGNKTRSRLNRRLSTSVSHDDRPLFRLMAVRVVIVAIFFLLFTSLLRVQIFEGPYFKSLADGNRTTRYPMQAPRGIIYDRKGRELVANLPAFRLHRCVSSGKNCESVSISKDQAIDLQAKGLSGNEYLTVDSVRSYLYHETTAHILGYVSEVTSKELSGNQNYSLGDRIGRGGVEEQYESRLRGRSGETLVEVDAVGNKVRVLSVKNPIAGENLKLAIDLELQKAAFEEIRGKRATVVASDPSNGQILAIASSPSFDPNVFTDLSLDVEDRSRQIGRIFSDSSQPLFDRAISGTYPPGSTFKIVTAIAGLETGKITKDTTIDDSGILVIGPYRFPNWKYLRDGGTQGVLNVIGALQKSNDIFFYRAGERIGVDKLGEFSQRLGATGISGIDLPGEQGGLFPDKKWQEKVARSWFLGDTYHLAIGQGDLLVTPLQVNQWTNAVANNGKICTPRVLLDNSVENRGRCQLANLKVQTIDLVKNGMIAACVPGGTAYPLFDFKDPKDKNRTIQIACKTGTAEFGDPENRTHAWLTAFAPAENPKISVTVLVEGAGEGSDVAAPIVKKILEKFFEFK